MWTFDINDINQNNSCIQLLAVLSGMGSIIDNILLLLLTVSVAITITIIIIYYYYQDICYYYWVVITIAECQLTIFLCICEPKNCL